jgi:hypothetical protein
MSTISLEQTRAQSAHSYLQSENLTDQRVKVKTRAEQSGLPLVEEHVTKGGFFSRFSRKKEAAPHASEEETREKRNLGAWFKKMNRKSAGFLAQILGADKSAKKGGPPMKWDHFAKVGKAPVLYAPWKAKVDWTVSFLGVRQVMIDMGFEVDASTAGSSVRFQPPDPTLRSISFHKRKYSATFSGFPGAQFFRTIFTLDIAHPESTIDPITLQKWGKKLKSYYGWSEEILLQHASLQF